MIVTKLIGRSAAHKYLLEKLSKIAPTEVEVLIQGESGTGKELYARYIHHNSMRCKAAFVPVNCGALPSELLENELFGHVGGAFTGARPQSEGLVAEAEHGTLFLDEVDSLSTLSQVKLLRFLQEKEYRRLGETRTRRANVRVIAATNIDLLAAMREGRFREDLFFRLRVVPVKVSPLRERAEDIPLLLSEYVIYYSETYRLPKIVFSDSARHRLETYHWPGNVRELENCVKYLTCLQLNRIIEPQDLVLLEADDGQEVAWPGQTTSSERPFRDAKRELVERFERAYLEDALRRSNGNIAKAARASAKPRRSFFE
ncbi:MAG: sigma-54 dependent transcriptional regulator, partial [Acidobacteriota bacterium]|nr:sigma-54 dependent transcriptional regulator [Acidobacteriota bacterium]